MEEASKHREVARTYMDSSYDSSKTYEYLDSGIEAIIEPRGNSRADRDYHARHEAARLFKGLGRKAWAKLKQYGKRWAVETAFLTFKRLSEEYCLSKNPNQHSEGANG